MKKLQTLTNLLLYSTLHMGPFSLTVSVQGEFSQKEAGPLLSSNSPRGEGGMGQRHQASYFMSAGRQEICKEVH